ncbi:immunoglobulin-like domain-containing protein [Enterococcus sp. AZ102]|uniref:immunoglobulin-like domain-containing protein n=1 Tax=Enterococcus sp. AZ102 TaxID=2774865 RepID=UPI003F25200D
MKKSVKILGVGLTTSLMMLGVLDLAEATSAAETKGYTMYRLYNPNNGEHFYTKNTQEQQQLVRVGWKDEGIGWFAPSKGSPVYRLYNKNAGDHHYTLNQSEKDSLVKVGWKDEGIGWYSENSQGVKLYRAYNPNAKAGSHNYTLNSAEQAMLIQSGWKDEGVAWYGMKTVKPTLTGASDTTVEQSAEKFDPLKGVAAKDFLGNSLSIKVSGSVDLAKPGVYTLTYSTVDGQKNTTTVTRKITVKKVENPSNELKIVKESAISKLNELTLTTSQKNQYINQINGAKTVAQVHELSAAAKTQSDKNSAATQQAQQLATAKKEAITKVNGLNLTAAQKNTYINQLNNAKTSADIKKIVTNAQTQSDQNTKAAQQAQQLAEAKSAGKNTVANLNLTNAQKTSYTNQLDGATSSGQITKIVSEAKTQSDKNTAAAQQAQRLADAKASGIEKLSRMNLTNEQKTTYTTQLNQATSVEQVNQIVATAQAQSDQNEAAAKQEQALKAAKKEAVTSVNAVNFDYAKKVAYTDQINNAKSIAQINQLVAQAKAQEKLSSAQNNSYETLSKTQIAQAAHSSLLRIPKIVTDQKYANFTTISQIINNEYRTKNQTIATFYAQLEQNPRKIYIGPEKYSQLTGIKEVNRRYRARMLQNINEYRLLLDLKPLQAPGISEDQNAYSYEHAMNSHIANDHIFDQAVGKLGSLLPHASGHAENLFPRPQISGIDKDLTPEALADSFFKLILEEYISIDNDDKWGHLRNVTEDFNWYTGGIYIDNFFINQVGNAIFGFYTQYAYSFTAVDDFY